MLFSKVKLNFKYIIILLLIIQSVFYILNPFAVITLNDGVHGLSQAKTSNAQTWLTNHYDYGKVLIDDYARSLSIIKSGIPMQDEIYIGTKPYWSQSLEQPEKYARWIIMQKNDAVWTALYKNKIKRAELYKYFNKVYTSNTILIFKRMPA